MRTGEAALLESTAASGRSQLLIKWLQQGWAVRSKSTHTRHRLATLLSSGVAHIRDIYP